MVRSEGKKVVVLPGRRWQKGGLLLRADPRGEGRGGARQLAGSWGWSPAGEVPNQAGFLLVKAAPAAMGVLLDFHSLLLETGLPMWEVCWGPPRPMLL